MSARERILENPFYVLGLSTSCGRAEIEQEGQKLLALLELGLSSGATYRTPLGPAKRTPEMVRHAMAELRDPEKRLRHELWAQLAADATLPERPTPATPPTERLRPWRSR
jgi:hypothetical protein